jgi:hypothetical protein
MTFRPIFCTLFNQFYLDKAIVMIKSLHKHCPNFHLYVFAFDHTTEHILKKINFKHVTVIPLATFESPDLLSIKDSRNPKEYCWTCTPFTIKYCLDTLEQSNCTYIDADLYFFNDPTPIFPETPWNTLITPHRYTPKYDASQDSGKFCVQWVSFQNTESSKKILYDWCKNCLDWCYEIPEDGKFGDQKYLDTWPQDYEGVISLEDPGIGIAPWNMQQYNFEKPLTFTPYFFHFHHIIRYQKGLVFLGDYPIPKSVFTYAYAPYLAQLKHAEILLNKHHFTSHVNNASWDKLLIATLGKWLHIPCNWQ